MKKMKTISAALLAIIMTFAMSASAFGETLPGAEAAGQDAEQTVTMDAGEAAARAVTDPAAQTEEPTQPPTGESTEPTQPTQPTQPATEPTQPSTQPTTRPAAPKINETAALNIALKNAGLSKSGVRIIEVEMDDGKSVEIEFIRLSNKAKYGYEIAVKDGRILEKSVDYKYKKSKSRKKIGKKKARKIVAKAAGKSYSVVKKGRCKYQYKKKCGKYEIKFRSGNYKYEYELLAKNGKIIEYEYEYIGIR